MAELNAVARKRLHWLGAHKIYRSCPNNEKQNNRSEELKKKCNKNSSIILFWMTLR